MEYTDGLPPNAIATQVCEKNPVAKQKTYLQTKIESDLENVETVKGLRNLYKSARFLGIYMPKNKKFLYFCWSFVINGLVTIYHPVGFLLGLMTFSPDKMEVGDILTSVQAFINVIGCSLKIILVGYLFPKLLKCEPLFQRLDNRCRNAEEMKSIKDCIKMANRFVIFFTCCYWTYSTSTCLSAIIFKRLPYNIYKPLIDAEASNLNFVLAACIEVAEMTTSCFQQVVSDSYAVIYVHILRTHLRILLKRLDNMNKSEDKSLEDNFNELKMCIIDHKNIIELYDNISAVISATIFVQFTITAIVLGITLINILIFATGFVSILASCFYFIAVVVEIFPLCYSTQCLMDESNCLADAIFHSNWADQDIRYRKMLIFFIQRSQVTVEFMAGKLVPINLNSFLSIAKFSFSLYTFIKEMGIKERFAG